MAFTNGDAKSDPVVKGSVLCNATLCVCTCVSTLSCFRLFGTPWTGARKAPLSTKSSGKNTGVGCHFLFQRIFSTQGSNSCLLHVLHWQVGSLPAEPPVKTYDVCVLAQSCLSRCDPMDCSPPGASVHGIKIEEVQSNETWR